MALKSPEQALRSVLLNDATVSAAIGTKVFPVLAPADVELPFITYRRAAIEREQTLGLPMGVPRVTIDFVVYALTYEAAREAADAVRLALDGYSGTVDTVTVRQTSLENESDDFVTLASAEMPPVYSVTLTFDCWWQET